MSQYHDFVSVNESGARAFKTGLARLGDWTSWASALVLVALLPITLICLSPFAAVTGAILPGGTATWSWIYLAAPVVVFIPGLQFLQAWLVGLPSRVPTAVEHARLVPAWNEIVERLGAGKKRRYMLRVVDDGCNLNQRPEAATSCW